MEGGQGGEERAVLDLDDPKLEEKLVSELKAQGVFDQFRKDCLSDVDTKPAYQNLRVRVDKSVSAYLDRTTWRSTLNKNQLRNQLRKYIQVHQRSCKGPGRGPKTGTESEKAGEQTARSLVGTKRGKPPPLPEAKNTKDREIPIQYFISK